VNRHSLGRIERDGGVGGSEGPQRIGAGEITGCAGFGHHHRDKIRILRLVHRGGPDYYLFTGQLNPSRAVDHPSAQFDRLLETGIIGRPCGGQPQWFDR